jgi:hypothetical protein
MSNSTKAPNVSITDEIEKLGINTLDLFVKHFNNYKYIPKTSESNSLIFTTELTSEASSGNSKKRSLLKPGSKFYLKIYPTDEGFDTLGLQTEMKIYNELYKLAKYNVTRNILCKTITIGMKHFDLLFDLIKESPNMTPELIEEVTNDIKGINLDAKKDVKLWKELLHKKYMWRNYELLMTHPGGDGTTFGDCYSTLTPFELKCVMFQIINTLYLFDIIEMSHGDLHSGNLFVVTLDKPKTFCYKLGTKNFQFTTNKLIKIFDFDNSSICKKSQIKLGLFKKVDIKQTLNPIREPGTYSNQLFAQTNIYNKNLDFLNLIASVIMFSGMDHENAFELADREFNEFLKDAFRGFSGLSEYSMDIIKNSIRKLADTNYIRGSTPKDKLENLKELNRIMGKPAKNEFDNVRFYDISKDILNMTWPDYYKNIVLERSKILKSLERVDNNHLWIPDEIVMDKLEMLNHPYFNEFIVSE